MLAKTGPIILIALFATVVVWSVYRDIHIERQYTNDLRNRVVGARFEKEHASPYSYMWERGDSVRYYDPANIAVHDSSLHASNITATPFFHHLLAPIADLPESTISRIWLWLEYLMLAACAFIALALASSRQQKAMVLATIALFLLTEAWKRHIAEGQYYLLIPLLALLLYYFLRQEKNLWQGVAAGCCAILLVLIRPDFIIFFLPLLLVIKRYPPRFLLAFFLPVAILAGWSLASREERSLWSDYIQLVSKQVKIHQGESYSSGAAIQPIHYYGDYEGWRKEDIKASYAELPYDTHSENGNVFVLFEKIFHRKTNVTILNIASVLTLLLLSAYYTWFHRSKAISYTLLSVTIFGFCLYMVTDLFSPIWRHQYYTIQWLCPVLLAAAAWKPSQKNLFVLLLLAMLLNIFNIPFVKMEHTMGEYLLLGVMLYLSLAVSSPPHPLSLPGGRLHTFLYNRGRSNR